MYTFSLGIKNELLIEFLMCHSSGIEVQLSHKATTVEIMWGLRTRRGNVHCTQMMPPREGLPTCRDTCSGQWTDNPLVAEVFTQSSSASAVENNKLVCVVYYLLFCSLVLYECFLLNIFYFVLLLKFRLILSHQVEIIISPFETFLSRIYHSPIIRKSHSNNVWHGRAIININKSFNALHLLCLEINVIRNLPIKAILFKFCGKSSNNWLMANAAISILLSQSLLLSLMFHKNLDSYELWFF